MLLDGLGYFPEFGSVASTHETDENSKAQRSPKTCSYAVGEGQI
jgi:hypothetical protein